MAQRSRRRNLLENPADLPYLNARMKTQVCIIGAGPAGLMAAISAAKAGAETALIEANSSAGRKLLRTGRTRCNLTHTGSVDDFIKAYGPFGRFLRHSLHDLSPDDLRRYFARHKLETKVEKDGCFFPVTDRASDVLRVLVDDARDLSVRFLYGWPVQGITKDQTGFLLLSNARKIAANAVIIATGGVTWPHTGSTGDGYRFAQALGHTIVEPKPCLVPLVTVEAWPAQLAGLGVPYVVITAQVSSRKLRCAGAMMFTHDGVGGPAVFDLSRLIADFLPASAAPINICVDLMPEYPLQELDKKIISLCSNSPRKELAGALAELLPRALLLKLCALADAPAALVASQLQKAQRRHLVAMLKKLPLSIKAAHPIAEATVTRGGVSTDEIDPTTMESKLCPGLFFAGEVMNVDGPSGGYNLQIAFSTGSLAGKTAAVNAFQLAAPREQTGQAS